MKQLVFILVAVLFLSACVNKKPDAQQKAGIADSVVVADYDAGYMTLAVLYYQRAAENRALYYQGFNIAKTMLENDMKAKSKQKKAIVLDIDETVLDNSPYEAQCIIGKFSYPERWEEWCNKAVAEPTPGSLDFLTFAKNNNYEVFYVTNRKAKLAQGTLKNLRDKGFPFADTSHVLFRTEGNSKEARRQQILKTYSIVLLMGDNLADFVNVFDDKMNADKRASKTDSLKLEFGKHFIVFPNPMYGDWEMALYPDPAAAAAVKDSLRMSFLKGF